MMGKANFNTILVDLRWGGHSYSKTVTLRTPSSLGELKHTKLGNYCPNVTLLTTVSIS